MKKISRGTDLELVRAKIFQQMLQGRSTILSAPPAAFIIVKEPEAHLYGPLFTKVPRMGVYRYREGDNAFILRCKVKSYLKENQALTVHTTRFKQSSLRSPPPFE